jgi:hypothetical protein
MNYFILNLFFLNKTKTGKSVRCQFLRACRKKCFFSVLLIGFLTLSLPVFAGSTDEECTIGVAAGRATVDGRPLLWKNRDNDSVEENEVIFVNSYPYDFLAVIDAGQSGDSWMGINNKGLALLNSVTSNIDENSGTGLRNGALMTEALRTCASLDEFTQLLVSTNEGRRTATCIGAIDSTGAAAMFEVSNYNFIVYPATDTFVVRANFALSGAYGSSTYSMPRYKRAKTLFLAAIEAGQLDHRYILQQVSRDLVNKQVDPYPLPYEDANGLYGVGYLNTYESINRHRTRSVAVFHGVRAGENPLLSTMWIILGEPVTCAAVPLWVFGGMTPSEVNGAVDAPLNRAAIVLDRQCYDRSNNPQLINTFVLDDGAGGGFLPRLVAFENETIDQTTTLLNAWRAQFPEKATVKTAQENFAESTLQFMTGLGTAVENFPKPAQPVAAHFRLEQSYPNPFSISGQAELVIPVTRNGLPGQFARIQIFNTLGQLVFQHEANAETQTGQVVWQGVDLEGKMVSNGVYFVSLQTAGTRQSHQILILP